MKFINIFKSAKDKIAESVLMLLPNIKAYSDGPPLCRLCGSVLYEFNKEDESTYGVLSNPCVNCLSEIIDSIPHLSLVVKSYTGEFSETVTYAADNSLKKTTANVSYDIPNGLVILEDMCFEGETSLTNNIPNIYHNFIDREDLIDEEFVASGWLLKDSVGVWNLWVPEYDLFYHIG